MRTEYKRDMNHSYLILRGTEQVDTASYQIRMLAGNAVPGLLKCRLQGVDGHMDFYYEITSRQPVSALYESRKLGNEDLQLIFGGFVRVLEEMAEFLLNPENLLISPEYMYVDIEKKEMYFCYLPGYDHEVRAQLQTLTEYVLPKLDHEDGRAVMLGYGIYRRALEDSFHLEHLKEELYCVRDGEIPSELYGKKQKEQKMTFLGEDGAEPQKEKEEDPSLWRMGSESKEISEKKTSEEKEGPVRRWIRTLSGCIAAAAAVMCLVVLRTLGYLPWLTVEAMAGACLVLLGTGTFLSCLLAKRQRRKKEKDETPGTARQQEDRRRSGQEELESILAGSEPEENREKTGQISQGSGETVLLSANVERGPASLVSREPGELATIYLKDEITVVGKLETAADAVIPLPTVSRVHAKIRQRDGEFYLCDLNSRNGTSVNGRMLKNDEEYLLQDEDQVDFAQARYVFLK